MFARGADQVKLHPAPSATFRRAEGRRHDACGASRAASCRAPLPSGPKRSASTSIWLANQRERDENVALVQVSEPRRSRFEASSRPRSARRPRRARAWCSRTWPTSRGQAGPYALADALHGRPEQREPVFSTSSRRRRIAASPGIARLLVERDNARVCTSADLSGQPGF
jgi:hypothetical protein